MYIWFFFNYSTNHYLKNGKQIHTHLELITSLENVYILVFYIIDCISQCVQDKSVSFKIDINSPNFIVLLNLYNYNCQSFELFRRLWIFYKIQDMFSEFHINKLYSPPLHFHFVLETGENQKCRNKVNWFINTFSAIFHPFRGIAIIRFNVIFILRCLIDILQLNHGIAKKQSLKSGTYIKKYSIFSEKNV